jgi:phosphate transport system substrate-binding protein
MEREVLLLPTSDAPGGNEPAPRLKRRWNAALLRFGHHRGRVIPAGKPLTQGAMVAGAYRVVASLAEGGMGAIYEVEQVATGARRALKVMHVQFAGDDSLRARFVREARLTAAIPSDHVAQVVDAGLDPASGALFIVMELLEGSTLSQELRRRGSFGWSDTLQILGQVAHALGAAHAQGIVHRDLKPSNVFLSKSRHASLTFMVKLLDFGIAKAVAIGSDATAAVLGTPTWMAPEQTNVEATVGPEADVWSFGLLAFSLLTGRHYFATANAKTAATAAVLREVIVDPLRPASERAGEMGFGDRLPGGFDDWFARCVDRVPLRRFHDAREAYEALSILAAPSPSETPSPSQARLRALSSVRVETPITAIETPRPRGFGNASGGSPSTTPSAGTAATGVVEPTFAPYAMVGALFGLLLVGLLVVMTRQTSPARAAPALAGIPTTAPPGTVSLRLHGSNTIGSELAPALAQAFLQRRTAANAVVRRRTALDEMRVEARDGDKVIDAIEIFAHGTRTAFEDLGAGRCDIGMASSRIHEDEAQKLAPLGNLMSAASEHVVALDGVAVIVNPANPVGELTTTQIADVFAGKVQRWSEVGGLDQPIAIHARDDKSGTYDSFKHLVLGARALSPAATRHESSEELSDAVAGDATAIGFIGLSYVRSAKAVLVQEKGTFALLPSPMTVATEDYPLSRRLYLYAPSSASQEARDFVDFALSEDGQRAVLAAGFVDMRPTCDPSAARCTSCPRDYADAVKGACRVSVDLRFEPGTRQLDTRALGDLTRIVALTRRPDLLGRSVLLLGFSEARATKAESLAASQQWVDIVAQQLSARGLHVDLERGLGAEMPVGDGATDEGRMRSRRVEVWLR